MHERNSHSKRTEMKTAQFVFYASTHPVPGYHLFETNPCLSTSVRVQLAPFPCAAALLKELTSDHGGENSSALADRALDLVNSVPSLDFESREHRTAALQLHTTAINLWNLAVGLKTAGVEGGGEGAGKSKILNAQCESVEYCSSCMQRERFACVCVRARACLLTSCVFCVC